MKPGSTEILPAIPVWLVQLPLYGADAAAKTSLESSDGPFGAQLVASQRSDGPLPDAMTLLMKPFSFPTPLAWMPGYVAAVLSAIVLLTKNVAPLPNGLIQ